LCSCAPQHARVLAGEVHAGPLVLFPLRRTSPRRCAPARRAAMAFPWGIALRTRLQGSGAPSSGCIVHASPPNLAHTRTHPCPAAGSMSAAARFASARAPSRATLPRHFAANSGPKPEPLAPPRPCAPKRTRVHTQHGHLTALPCTAAASTQPCRPWRRPRRAGRLLPCSSPSSPSDPRGSREARHGA
jgi:hypothetical protein